MTPDQFKEASGITTTIDAFAAEMTDAQKTKLFRELLGTLIVDRCEDGKGYQVSQLVREKTG